MNVYPIEVNSWVIFSEKVFVKKLDKSAFMHRGTGIPKKIKRYWHIDSMKHGDKRIIEVIYGDIKFSMKITCDNLLRTRLFWNQDFIEVLTERFYNLKRKYTDHEEVDLYPEMRFQRLSEALYSVEFVEEAESVVIYDEYVASTSKVEGRRVSYYSERYERNSNNRIEAINLHGFKCKVCGFIFEEKYGVWGKGYIEIHHLKPLYINEAEVYVDPQTDLVPVCSNCHRMIHRRKNDVLSIERLQVMISRSSV